MTEMFATHDHRTAEGVTGLQPKRADVILAGTCIVCSIMEMLNVPSFTVSDRENSPGTAFELFSQA